MKPKLTPLKWFVILTVIAIALGIGLPPDPHAVQQLHTSATAYRMAVAALLLPYALIWYLSFYAFAKLQEYSLPLKKTKDGVAFNKITIGMGTLAFSLITPTIISLVIDNLASHHGGFKSASIIIDNYMSLLPGMIALLLLYNGSRALLRTAKGGAEKLDLRLHLPWVLLFCIVFSHLTIENQYRYHPYHLAIWILVSTIIVPYLYTWMMGMLCTYDLYRYAKTVPGSLYRQAIKQFARGIGVVIIASIMIQFVDVTVAQRIGHSLGLVLLIDYVLLIIAATGLALMARGTKKLKRIEEI